jgi:pimeloyl-ACP methyl ester carboxylesterase
MAVRPLRFALSMTRLRRFAVWMLGGIALVLVTGLVVQAVFERQAAAYPAPGQLVTVAGERRLHVICEGEGSPTVILEAGGTHFSSQYASVQHALARLTRVCAYDRAGMGWSDPIAAPLSARALVTDFEALVANANIAPPYILVAGSAGGITVELYAREHPDRVAALVLLDALTGRMIDDMPDVGDAMENQACRARTLNRFGVLRLLDPLQRYATRDRVLSYRNATWEAICSLVRARHASADQLRAAPPLRPDLPVVVIRHDGDAHPDDEARWQPAQARNAAMTTRGELSIASGSGHHIAEDRPDLVISAVTKLLAR